MYDNERLPPLEDLPPADHGIESRFHHVGEGDVYSERQPEIMPADDPVNYSVAAGRPVVPPTTSPPGAVPAGAMPAGAMPAGAMPAGAMPAGAMPPNALPPNALPPNALPPNALPSDAALAEAPPARAMPLTAMPMAALRRIRLRQMAGGVPSNAAVPQNAGVPPNGAVPPNGVRAAYRAYGGAIGGPARTVRWVNYVLWIIEILLAIRVLLELLAANPGAIFSGLMYLITWPLVLPFSGVFPSPTGSGHVLDAAALLAMAIYPLVAWAIDRLVELKRRRGTGTV